MAKVSEPFDAHVTDPRLPVCVAMNFPNPWPLELSPIYRVCFGIYEDAAMLLGNIFCRVAIARRDCWFSWANTALAHKPRKYILQGNLLGPLFGIGGGERRAKGGHP